MSTLESPYDGLALQKSFNNIYFLPTSFILPGGNLLASILHLSRTISRRAETHVVALLQNEEINKNAGIYLNRVSDLMFILARIVNHRKNISDIVWKH